MASFKQPDFIERQEAAAKARKVALEKFRAKAADPALAERLTARAARAAERSAIKTTREIERAEKEVREAARAHRPDATLRLRPSAPRPKAENVNARCKPNKRRPETPVTPPANRDRSAGRFARYMGHKNFLHGSRAVRVLPCHLSYMTK
jgi:hypothetical protein